MNKLFYPAVFHAAEEGGYWVSFPDFPECFTQGETLDETYEMAVDALGLCVVELEQAELPKASAPNIIELKENESIVLIEFDMEAYRRKHSARAVKKTLTIPEWLNEEAMKLGLNFSQVLQEALMLKIGRV